MPQQFQETRNAACGVCEADGQVLLARYVAPTGEKWWTSPGGGVEHGDLHAIFHFYRVRIVGGSLRPEPVVVQRLLHHSRTSLGASSRDVAPCATSLQSPDVIQKPAVD